MRFSFIVIGLVMLVSCKEKKEESNIENIKIAIGSCNNQAIPNILFKEIVKNNPDQFIWLGDAIYSDTNSPEILQKNFNDFKKDTNYLKLTNKISVTGIWDDHDYGLNDGGKEHLIKDQAQQIYLDFLNVSKEDVRRKRKGVYHSKTIEKNGNTVKLILLDTRYFRSELDKDLSGKKRYAPTKDTTKTMLGEVQWNWLENELKNNNANFTVLASSIQLLSYKHGYESWGNMPHEVEKLKKLLVKTNSKNVIFLSGDRHISEISRTNIGKNLHPLIDFTSSGMTHAYYSFSGEENEFRVSKVVNEISFGLMTFDFEKNQVLLEMKGKDNVSLEKFTQNY